MQDVDNVTSVTYTRAVALDRSDRDALDTAARLAAMGVDVRSAELQQKASEVNDFVAKGGNRAMRRARARRRG